MDGDRPDCHPIHRAIDELTAVMLNVQQLERHAATAPPDAIAAGLRAAHVRLRELGTLLLEIRDEATNKHLANPPA